MGTTGSSNDLRVIEFNKNGIKPSHLQIGFRGVHAISKKFFMELGMYGKLIQISS
jgi:hypothetical protein